MNFCYIFEWRVYLQLYDRITRILSTFVQRRRRRSWLRLYTWRLHWVARSAVSTLIANDNCKSKRTRDLLGSFTPSWSNTASAHRSSNAWWACASTSCGKSWRRWTWRMPIISKSILKSNKHSTRFKLKWIEPSRSPARLKPSEMPVLVRKP